MILWAMIFALGVLASSLCWLLTLPVLSRRAVRLATARIERRLPATTEEINVERDQLRAAHAVAMRRLEQAGEAVNARLAAAMSENGRHVARIAGLEQAGADLKAEVTRLAAELADAGRRLDEGGAALEAQTAESAQARALAAQHEDLLRATRERLEAEKELSDERRATLAGLATRAAGQETQLQSALDHGADLANELAAAKAALEAMTAQRDGERADRLLLASRQGSLPRAEELRAELDRAVADLEDATRTSARANRRLQLQAETINGLADRVLAQDKEIAALQRLLEQARTRRERIRRPAADETRVRGAPPAAVLGSQDDSGPDPGDGGREARLRAAVAAVGAELVAFSQRAPGSERDSPDRPDDPAAQDRAPLARAARPD